MKKNKPMNKRNYNIRWKRLPVKKYKSSLRMKEELMIELRWSSEVTADDEKQQFALKFYII